MTVSLQSLLDNFTLSHDVPQVSLDAPIADAIHLCDIKYFTRLLEMSMTTEGVLWSDALKESLAYLVGTDGHGLHGGEHKVKALCESLWDVKRMALRPITDEWKDHVRAAWY